MKNRLDFLAIGSSVPRPRLYIANDTKHQAVKEWSLPLQGHRSIREYLNTVLCHGIVGNHKLNFQLFGNTPAHLNLGAQMAVGTHHRDFKRI